MAEWPGDRDPEKGSGAFGGPRQHAGDTDGLRGVQAMGKEPQRTSQLGSFDVAP